MREPGPRGGTRTPLRAIVTLLLLLLLPAGARAQIFIASRPSPGLRVAPLFVRASVGPALGDVPVEIVLGLVVPPTRSGLEFQQDLYLLWPGPIVSPLPGGRHDAGLTAEVERLGLDVIAEGRLPLFLQKQYEAAGDAVPVGDGAPFVTVVGSTGPLGLTDPASLIRIPWTPDLVNPARAVGLRLTARDLIHLQKASWLHRIFTGPRYHLALGWNDVGPPAMFTMYLAHRDRVLRLADPARLMVEFADAGEVSIDGIAPESSRRERSQTRDDTDVVSLFLSPREGLAAQTLAIEFTYFSGLQAWGAVLIPVLFFVLGNAAAPLVRTLAERLMRTVRARVQLGGPRGRERVRQSGTLISREQLARIVPGETTYEAVVALCGREVEEREGLADPGRKTLVYRGRREVPQRRWTWGWVAAVDHWNVEEQEVEIVVEGGVVRDVQVRVRRSRLTHPA